MLSTYRVVPPARLHVTSACRRLLSGWGARTRTSMCRSKVCRITLIRPPKWGRNIFRLYRAPLHHLLERQTPSPPAGGLQLRPYCPVVKRGFFSRVRQATAAIPLSTKLDATHLAASASRMMPKTVGPLPLTKTGLAPDNNSRCLRLATEG